MQSQGFQSQLTAHSSQLTAHSLGERGFRSSPLSKIFLKKFSTSSTPGNNRPCKGFTLIELMVVVTLLGIFASIAVPAFSSLIANNRVESSASEFYAVLMAARADAVTQRTATTLSKVDSGNWELRQGGETQRTISLPDSVTLSSAPDSLTFRSDGTAESTSFVFITSKSNRSYTITVQLSGAIRLSGPTTTPSS